VIGSPDRAVAHHCDFIWDTSADGSSDCTAGSTLNHWPFPGSHLEEGYAYLLMHPGTPCVFYDHFWDQGSLGQAVRKLLKVRRTNGIHARSKVSRLLVNILLDPLNIQDIL